MNYSIRDRLVALEPHVVIEMEGARKASEVMARPELAALRNDPNLQLSFFESQDVILRTMDGQFRGAVARGLDENGLRDFFTELDRLREKDKSANTFPVSTTLEPGDVLVGIDLARSLGIFEGDQLQHCFGSSWRCS